MPEEPRLVIAFVAGTTLMREADRRSDLPILRNGPPGTFVLFGNAFRVSLPTDQIVLAEETAEGVRVGFGGMAFDGAGEGRLVFQRVRELAAEERLSPDRSHTMILERAWVRSVTEHGRIVWP